MSVTITIPLFMVFLQKLYNGTNCTQKAQIEIGVSYAYLLRLKDEFIRLNWIIEEKEGRKKVLKLTDKGSKIAKCATDFLISMQMKVDEEKEEKTSHNKNVQDRPKRNSNKPRNKRETQIHEIR